MKRKTFLQLGSFAVLCLVGTVIVLSRRPHPARLRSTITPPPAATAAAAVLPSAASSHLDHPAASARIPFSLDAIPADAELRTELEALPTDIRTKALADLANNANAVHDVRSLHVDRTGALYYACRMAPSSSAAEAVAPTAVTDAAAAVPIDQPPIRHSRPGATNVLYLDFNGHTISRTAWADGETLLCQPFDTDSDPTSFSASEQDAIIQVWERVAEDYTPFNIDVTTEEPASFGSRTARALITRGTTADGVSLPQSDTAAGVAFLGYFGKNLFGYYSPALIYFDECYSYAPYIGEVVSHEIGHNLGLSHDGRTPSTEYYPGHGTGDTSWSTIMGAGYGRNVTQWSKGEYREANNSQDDLALLDGRLARRTDDIPGTVGSASPLPGGGETIGATGAIEREGDADLFSFHTDTGSVSVAVSPYVAPIGTRGGNVDLRLELLDATGTVLVTDAPTGTTGAALTQYLSAGTYVVRVSAEGCGDPMNPSSPTGYTAYGSLGQYTVRVTRMLATPVVTGPTAMTTRTGDTVDFTIQAQGAPSSYQAYNLPAWLTLDNVTGHITGTPNSTGDYYITLAASNNLGSSQCTLHLEVVAGPPTFTAPAPRTLAHPGERIAFAVTDAVGTPPLHYRWFHCGTEIAGETGTDLEVPSATAADAGWYEVEVSDINGARRSPPSFLVVAPVETDVAAFGNTLADSTDVLRTLRDVISVAPGQGSMVALRAGGSLHAWGTSYQYGLWILPGGLDNIVAIAGARLHTIALRADGTVAVWGSDDHPAALPLPIPNGLANVVAIAAHEGNCLVARADGTVVQWGVTAATFPPPANLGDIVSVALGADHALALRRDGTVVAWGSNAAGQATVPANLPPVRAIAADRGVSFAITRTNELVAWGTGHPKRIDQLPADLGPVDTISPSTTHATALLVAGPLRIWAATPPSWATLNPQHNDCGYAMCSGGDLTYLVRDRSLYEPATIMVAPADTVVQPGATATFPVSATGRPSPSIIWSYWDPEHPDWGWQWLPADGHHIAGGYGLSITDVPASFDGRQYRVYVSTATGSSVYSSPATLTVASGWPFFLAQNFSAAERADPDVSGPSADPDRDGLANLLEYAFGTDPRAPGSAGPAVEWRANTIQVAFDLDSTVTDLTVTLQSSTDLAIWTDVPESEFTRSTTAVSATIDHVVLLLNPSAEARRFYRLEASVTP